jgi:hypothetical protein
LLQPFLNPTTQKSALDVHDYQARTQSSSISPEAEKPQEIGMGNSGKAFADEDTEATLVSQNDSQNKRTPTRGELEQAIRSLRQGKVGSRKRMGQVRMGNSIRLSKIFVDGNNSRQSRIYDMFPT